MTMKLSLSGRLLEGAAPLPTVEFIKLAAAAGYDLVELRLHQVPNDPAAPALAEIRQALAETGLGVSMLVIGAPTGVAQWQPIAEALGTTRLRVHGSAADILAACGQLRGAMRLVSQMHTASPYEDIRSAAAFLAQVPDPRFGLMPEPANLLFAGETWRADLFAPLRGRILGCNAQSIVMADSGATTVKMNDGRVIPYQRVNWPDNQAVRLPEFAAALRQAGYDDFINFIDPAMPGRDLREYATETARYARAALGRG
jgi:sugar phosphate isomerase/epimerase